MLHEPRRYRGHDVDDGLRFLALSHTLLGYLSALGAHRLRQVDDQRDRDVTELAERVAEILGRLAEQLAAHQPISGLQAELTRLRERLDALASSARDDDTTYWPMRHQLRLVCRQLEPLGEAANRLVAPTGEDSGPTPARV
ncbi:hypothetical protein ACM26W_19355 [Halomonas sp. HK25]|uniref:hypothetical protein n=1 Tax=Halomonas sp. HK25 TaxID=3394321 RepID=UPI0039FC5ECD